jgi:hypothetical protein
MEASVENTPQDVRQVRDQVHNSGPHHNLEFKVLRADDGRMLVIVSNRSVASAYPLRPGWVDCFLRDLQQGLFG